MRLYFAMTEKNLAEKIFPYIPYQTMTWTDAELTKVLLDLTSFPSLSRLKSQFVYAIVSLDFNKFNQRWRAESTNPIFSIYDQLFGTPGLYTFSHEFFEKSFFYLSSRWKLPLSLTWNGQGGGCEGLRQKGWTAVIVSALAANEYETGIPSHIIGQGDNQVIIVSIRVPTDQMTPEEFLEKHPDMISRQLRAYLSNLEKLTKGCGMDLKLEESWISTKFMNYGKEIIIEGSYASNVLKKIGRAYHDVSEMYPTLLVRVASIGTAAQDASMKGFDVLTPYLIHLLEILCMIQSESRMGTMMSNKFSKLLSKRKQQQNDRLKTIMLIVPPECGGLPITPFTSLLYRGHPDPITSSLYWLKKLSMKFTEAKRVLDLYTSGFFLSKEIDPVTVATMIFFKTNL